MASSKGNYHRRGPYFDGTNFASWKHKMKMHILGHNPAVWAIVCIGLQGEFFDGREPNREATAEELNMLQYNAQACDILFNGLCPEEFNKISRLENAKEISLLGKGLLVAHQFCLLMAHYWCATSTTPLVFFTNGAPLVRH